MAVIVYGILEPVFYGVEDWKNLALAMEAINEVENGKCTKKTIFGNQFYLVFENSDFGNCDRCTVAREENCLSRSKLLDCVCLQCSAIRMHIFSNTEYRISPILIVDEVRSVSDNQSLFDLIMQSRLSHGTRIECLKSPKNTSLICSSLILANGSIHCIKDVKYSNASWSLLTKLMSMMINDYLCPDQKNYERHLTPIITMINSLPVASFSLNSDITQMKRFFFIAEEYIKRDRKLDALVLIISITVLGHIFDLLLDREQYGNIEDYFLFIIRAINKDIPSMISSLMQLEHSFISEKKKSKMISALLACSINISEDSQFTENPFMELLD